MPWQPDPLDISVLNLALDEDLGSPWCDVTSELLFPPTGNSQSYQRQNRIQTPRTHHYLRR